MKASDVTRKDIVPALRSVIDPEVGINIVDLGLIYDLQLGDSAVTICLTMTTLACPMTSYIKQEVGKALQQVQGLERGVIETVWEPAWTPHMIAPEARRRRFARYR